MLPVPQNMLQINLFLEVILRRLQSLTYIAKVCSASMPSWLLFPCAAIRYCAGPTLELSFWRSFKTAVESWIYCAPENGAGLARLRIIGPLIKALAEWLLLHPARQDRAVSRNASAAIPKMQGSSEILVRCIWHSTLDVANKRSLYEWDGPAALDQALARVRRPIRVHREFLF